MKTQNMDRTQTFAIILALGMTPTCAMIAMLAMEVQVYRFFSEYQLIGSMLFVTIFGSSAIAGSKMLGWKNSWGPIACIVPFPLFIVGGITDRFFMAYDAGLIRVAGGMAALMLSGVICLLAVDDIWRQLMTERRP